MTREKGHDPRCCSRPLFGTSTGISSGRFIRDQMGLSWPGAADCPIPELSVKGRFDVQTTSVVGLFGLGFLECRGVTIFFSRRGPLQEFAGWSGGSKPPACDCGPEQGTHSARGSKSSQISNIQLRIADSITSRSCISSGKRGWQGLRYSVTPVCESRCRW
jgi:hypothetical protein